MISVCNLGRLKWPSSKQAEHRTAGGPGIPPERQRGPKGASLMESCRLKRWRPRSSLRVGQFFTCARPGRYRPSHGSFDPVPDDVVDEWVRGLPGDLNTVIVSLLGRKPDERSEFSFYSFHGAWDLPEERRDRPSFQDWLNRRHNERSIQVLEHPTCDYGHIPQKTLDAVSSDISRLLSEGRTVVLVDSGGDTRTCRQVCKYLQFIEDPNY